MVSALDGRPSVPLGAVTRAATLRATRSLRWASVIDRRRIDEDLLQGAGRQHGGNSARFGGSDVDTARHRIDARVKSKALPDHAAATSEWLLTQSKGTDQVGAGHQ